MQNIPISIPGLNLLKAELEELKKIRPEIKKDVEEAFNEVDPNENTGYQAARERLALVENKIIYIESRMPLLEVLDFSEIPKDVVSYGAFVVLEDINSGEKKEYTLLGPDETDYVKKSVSMLSPVGIAMIGKEIGDEITVEVPRGILEYEIISISYTDPLKYFPKA